MPRLSTRTKDPTTTTNPSYHPGLCCLLQRLCWLTRQQPMWTVRPTCNCNRWLQRLQYVTAKWSCLGQSQYFDLQIPGDPVLSCWPHSPHNCPQGWHHSRLWQVCMIALKDCLLKWLLTMYIVQRSQGSVSKFVFLPEFLWWRMDAL